MRVHKGDGIMSDHKYDFRPELAPLSSIVIVNERQIHQ